MNDATTPPISSASVKVMRSYDYCHFEVVLGTNDLYATGCSPLLQIDNLRKEAMRLADKAVEQYKIAKEDAEQRLGAINTTQHSDWHKRQFEKAMATPEAERTPEEKAEIKAWDDAIHHSRRAPYDYEDDWQDDDQDS